MQNFRYNTFPQEVVFGEGALEKISDAVGRHGWARAMLVTTRSQRANGNVGRMETLLGDKLVAVFDAAQPHVPQANVDTAVKLAHIQEIDLLIALGGGSAIGVAKATGHAMTVAGGGSMPILAIPTTYAGSEMTPVFGVTRERDGIAKKETTSDARILPRVVLYDPGLTLDLPRDLTASTGINAFAHCVEAIYSITRNPLSTAAALEGAGLIFKSLPRAFANGSDHAARAELLAGAYLAGAALANVAMGLHHGVCHVLGGTANVPHGIANAIVLPHAIRFNADVCAQELARIADRIGIPRGDEYGMAMEAAQGVQTLVRGMKLPTRLREAHVREQDLPKLAALAFQNKTVQNNPKKMERVEEMERFLRETW
jgi:maleylacetate reductase